MPRPASRKTSRRPRPNHLTRKDFLLVALGAVAKATADFVLKAVEWIVAAL